MSYKPFKMKGHALPGVNQRTSPMKHAGSDDYAHHKKITDETSKWNRYLGSEIQYWWADRPWGDDPGGRKRLHKKYEKTAQKGATKTVTKMATKIPKLTPKKITNVKKEEKVIKNRPAPPKAD